jgi:hypothetical protein
VIPKIITQGTRTSALGVVLKTQDQGDAADSTSRAGRSAPAYRRATG